MNKKTKYQIIDNFLNYPDFINLKNVMMGETFPWFFTKEIAIKGKISDLEYYMTHLFYQGFNIKSNFFDLILPIINKLNLKSIMRIKGNLYPNMGKEIINEKHIDTNFKHKGAIYYINTNNGFTVLSDGTKIKSIENRILLFDPSEPHNSTHCTDTDARFNINLNYF